MRNLPSIERQLREIVSRRLRIPPDEVPLDKSITSELELDSMDVIRVVLDIEEAFAPLDLSKLDGTEIHTLEGLAKHIEGGL
jgi:acyl carrier protein